MRAAEEAARRTAAIAHKERRAAVRGAARTRADAVAAREAAAAGAGAEAEAAVSIERSTSVQLFNTNTSLGEVFNMLNTWL